MPDPLFKRPPDITPISPQEQELMDLYFNALQEKDPLWKKVARGGFEGIMGGVQGLLGQEFTPGAPTMADKGNAAVQLLLAGLPFSAIMKGRPAYHGTGEVFRHFDPTKYDKSDVLGWMTHLAENPKYAETSYAMGGAKGWKGSRPNVIAAVPEAKNVLDLIDPNPDDMAAALALLPKNARTELINTFKNARLRARLQPEIAQNLLPERHYGGQSVPPDEIPLRRLAEELRFSEEETKRMPFDAIRYRDVNEKSWAIPESTPIRSYYGKAPLTEEIPESPIRMIRDESLRSGPALTSKDLLELYEQQLKEGKISMREYWTLVGKLPDRVSPAPKPELYKSIPKAPNPLAK